MRATVIAEITVSSRNSKLIESTRRALSPDNRVVPPGMSIKEETLSKGDVHSYVMRIEVTSSNTVLALTRCRSTIDEVLSILELIAKSLPIE